MNEEGGREGGMSENPYGLLYEACCKLQVASRKAVLWQKHDFA